MGKRNESYMRIIYILLLKILISGLEVIFLSSHKSKYLGILVFRFSALLMIFNIIINKIHLMFMREFANDELTEFLPITNSSI